MSDDPKGYYKTLGLDKSASEKDVKKAYRKLALKWHPDVCKEKNAEDEFKKLAEAYEVLSNAKRRKEYDTPEPASFFIPRGNAGPSARSNFATFGSNNQPFTNPFDLFKNFFGDEDPFADSFFGSSLFGNRRSNNNLRQTRDPFGDAFGFSSSFGSTSLGSFPAFGSMGTGGPAFSSTSTITKIVDGKKVTTKETVNGNKKTKEVYENDQLVSKIVDGREMLGIGSSIPQERPRLAQERVLSAPLPQVRRVNRARAVNRDDNRRPTYRDYKEDF